MTPNRTVPQASFPMAAAASLRGQDMRMVIVADADISAAQPNR
jgi:hypothetical protein